MKRERSRGKNKKREGYKKGDKVGRWRRKEDMRRKGRGRWGEEVKRDMSREKERKKKIRWKSGEEEEEWEGIGKGDGERLMEREWRNEKEMKRAIRRGG